ncbi:FHA domain-containing protein [Gimesia panareensis]|uniref:Oxoglutarate dehydrogenase inhibitor n=1 Tax=Gimesia panareensis TaxID=2527978 RepID=A0A518A0U0_9PLAN|nr:FHA domain-containing protein [Gimesia panareensis]QDT25383.1 Oxoglutarate dehydrogenase inhibitor [Gimesia panareensis]QDU48343.1 Oxoglutarate dehydrogenase inhibitor [Gimesia panareensis]
MPKFIIKTGKYQGKTLKLPERDVTLGREPDCDIRVPDPDVSRKHCQLSTREGTLYVTDLQSRNGTYVNDQVIEAETPLKPGDLLRVGPMMFELAGPKKSIQKPSNLSPDQSAPLSDDDISTWLSEESQEEEPGKSIGDTTIISGSQLPRTEPPPPKEKKEFQSIAEEAAEIIRRHWAQVASQKQEKQ